MLCYSHSVSDSHSLDSLEPDSPDSMAPSVETSSSSVDTPLSSSSEMILISAKRSFHALLASTTSAHVRGVRGESYLRAFALLTVIVFFTTLITSRHSARLKC